MLETLTYTVEGNQQPSLIEGSETIPQGSTAQPYFYKHAIKVGLGGKRLAPDVD